MLPESPVPLSPQPGLQKVVEAFHRLNLSLSDIDHAVREADIFFTSVSSVFEYSPGSEGVLAGPVCPCWGSVCSEGGMFVSPPLGTVNAPGVEGDTPSIPWLQGAPAAPFT